MKIDKKQASKIIMQKLKDNKGELEVQEIRKGRHTGNILGTIDMDYLEDGFDDSDSFDLRTGIDEFGSDWALLDITDRKGNGFSI